MITNHILGLLLESLKPYTTILHTHKTRLVYDALPMVINHIQALRR